VTGHESTRVAGIDYGTVRIGIALADTAVGIASPFENYTRRTPALDAEYFQRLAEEERIGRFVVGLPVHLSGRESQKSTEARAFGAWLGGVTGVRVEYFDERFTTSEADELLSTVKFTKKQRQARRDQLAAQIMLAAYLEAGGRGQTSPDRID
jgi:putative Holliday junction resolvase